MRTDITEEEAWAVINAAQKREKIERAEQAREFVGRYFKFSGKEHWRCVKVTGVDEGIGAPTGLELRIELRQGPTGNHDSIFFMQPMQHWTEIDEAEFRRLTAIVPDEALSL